MPGVWPLGPVVSWLVNGEAAPAYLAIFPSRPVASSALGPLSAHRRVLRGVHFPLLPLFLPFLSLFSAAGHVSSSPKAGAQWVPACGHRTWVGSGGLVPSLWLTEDLESDPSLGSVFLAVIIPAARAAVTEAWDQLGAWGLSVREAVAFLGPLPPQCGPSPPLRAAGSERVSEGQGASCGFWPPPRGLRCWLVWNPHVPSFLFCVSF